MTIDQQLDLDARLHHLEAKMDRVLDLVTRVADDLDHVTSLRESVSGLADIRADMLRGFADLRNAVRHFGARIGETDRYRSR